jgi:hypothetical protein
LKESREEVGKEGVKTNVTFNEENRRNVIRTRGRVFAQLFADGCNCFLSEDDAIVFIV